MNDKKNRNNPGVVTTEIPVADELSAVRDGLEGIAGTENQTSSLKCGADGAFQGKTAIMLVQNNSTPLEIRLETAIAIRHLLAENGNNLDKRQDAILKQLLEVLNT